MYTIYVYTVYLCIYIYVCILYMYVCMYVYMFVYCICMYACMYVCILCIYVFMYVYCVCMCVCYICMYVCMYVYHIQCTPLNLPQLVQVNLWRINEFGRLSSMYYYIRITCRYSNTCSKHIYTLCRMTM